MLGTHKCSLPLGFICDIFSVDSRFPQSSSFFAQFLCFFSLVSDDFREFIETKTLSFPWAILTTKYRTDRHLNAGVLSLFYSLCLVVCLFGHQNGGYVYAHHCLRRLWGPILKKNASRRIQCYAHVLMTSYRVQLESGETGSYGAHTWHTFQKKQQFGEEKTTKIYNASSFSLVCLLALRGADSNKVWRPV